MNLSAKDREELKTNPATFIEKRIKEFALTSPSNRLSFLNDYIIWDEPLVGFAVGDDPIFTEYKRIISLEHVTPRETLAKTYDKMRNDMPVHLSVISWILPTAEETRKSNRAETLVPSRLWSHTRWYGEKFNDELRSYIIERALH